MSDFNQDIATRYCPKFTKPVVPEVKEKPIDPSKGTIWMSPKFVLLRVETRTEQKKVGDIVLPNSKETRHYIVQERGRETTVDKGDEVIISRGSELAFYDSGEFSHVIVDDKDILGRVTSIS